MGIFSGLYLVNLLCAVVNCEGHWAPVQAFIDKNQMPTSPINLRSNNESENLLFAVNFNPIVVTLSGPLQGYSMGSISGRRICAFEGIPYAKPPNNRRLRFKAPVPKEKWNHVRAAMKKRPNCLQMNPLSGFRATGSEDCLYLNIYRPSLLLNTTTDRLLPVIIFFHGGSYYFGGGAEYGPSYLLDHKDVILVTVTYRQGVLGFLSTGDKWSPGNYGLKDQAMAMKFVHDNIERFGGDSSRVTLMGQSTGGCSVHLHMIANKTRNYFRNAYTLSGSAFIHWAVQSPVTARQWTVKLANIVGCPTYDNEQMMHCFRLQNPSLLVAYQMHLFEIIPLPVVLFAPTIESRDDPEAFLTETPQEAYERGTVANKSLVSTVLTQEGHTSVYILRLTMVMRTVKQNIHKYLPTLLGYNNLTKDPDKLTDKIWKFYHGNVQPRNAPDDFISEMATDRYFMAGIQKGIQAHSKIAPTYPLLFAYKGRFNSGGHLYGANKDEWGLGHCEDLYYYFNASIYADGYKRSEPEYELTQILTNLLYNFASQNEPLYTAVNGQNVKIWDPVENPNKLKFLQISPSIRMVDNKYKKRVAFWETLGLPDTTPLRKSTAHNV